MFRGSGRHIPETFAAMAPEMADKIAVLKTGAAKSLKLSVLRGSGRQIPRDIRGKGPGHGRTKTHFEDRGGKDAASRRRQGARGLGDPTWGEDGLVGRGRRHPNRALGRRLPHDELYAPSYPRKASSRASRTSEISAKIPLPCWAIVGESGQECHGSIRWPHTSCTACDPRTTGSARHCWAAS